MTVGGIDLGATNLRAAVGDEDGRVVGRADGETPDADGERVTEAVLGALREACEGAGVEPTALSAVGIGSIGPLDLDAGAVVEPPNVRADRIELADPVGRACDCPVSLHNDCVAGAIGERFYADAGPNFVYLTLSSGVGAGAVVDGHVLVGARGNAAEMGHVVVEPGGRRCGCGGEGHWEAYCSGEAIPEYARTLARGENVSTSLDLSALTAAEVFAARENGDPLAERVVDGVGVYNARGVSAIVHAFDPDTVAVGGAVALANPDAVLDPIRQRLPDIVVADVPEVRLTDLGADAVLRGALASALTRGTGDTGPRA